MASRIRVQHEAVDRFRITIGTHELVVDQPSPSGDGAGPTPTELFVASLAACAGFFARRFLARHGLQDGELTVSAGFAWSTDHARVESVDLAIDVPGLDPALVPALTRVIDGCTVHRSLREPPAVAVRISGADRPARPGGAELSVATRGAG